MSAKEVRGDHSVWSDVMLHVAEALFARVPHLHHDVATNGPSEQSDHTVSLRWTWAVPAKKVAMLAQVCKVFRAACEEQRAKQAEYGCWALQRFLYAVSATATVFLRHEDSGGATVLLQCHKSVLCEVQMHRDNETDVLRVRHSFTEYADLLFELDVLYEVDFDELRQRLLEMYFARGATRFGEADADAAAFYPSGRARKLLRAAVAKNEPLHVEPAASVRVTFNQAVYSLGPLGLTGAVAAVEEHDEVREGLEDGGADVHGEDGAGGSVAVGDVVQAGDGADAGEVHARDGLGDDAVALEHCAEGEDDGEDREDGGRDTLGRAVVAVARATDEEALDDGERSGGVEDFVDGAPRGADDDE